MWVFVWLPVFNSYEGFDNISVLGAAAGFLTMVGSLHRLARADRIGPKACCAGTVSDGRDGHVSRRVSLIYVFVFGYLGVLPMDHTPIPRPVEGIFAEDWQCGFGLDLRIRFWCRFDDLDTRR